MGRFCWNCGKKNKGHTLYCPWCGAKLGNENVRTQKKPESQQETEMPANGILPVRKELLVVIGIAGACAVVALFLLGVQALKQKNERSDTTKAQNWEQMESIYSEDTKKTDQEITDEDDTTITEQEIIDHIGENVFLTLVNAMPDGTIWARAHDLVTKEEYYARVTPYGEVLAEKPKEEVGLIHYVFDEDEGRALVGDESFRIVGLTDNKDYTDEYLYGYDEICDYYGGILVIRKKVDTFEESYYCLGLVNEAGEKMFEISLDKETLKAQYGVNDNGEVDTIDPLNSEKGIYTIKLSYTEYLLIDLKRNKVIPVEDHNNERNSSDGDYTVEGHLVINHDTGEVKKWTNDNKLHICGAVSEHIFPVLKQLDLYHDSVVLMDVNGNELADLGKYDQEPYRIEPFYQGIAFVVWVNQFIGFINAKGDMLCEPHKADLVNWKVFYDSVPFALYVTGKDEYIHLLTPDGNEQVIDSLPADAFDIIEVMYEGRDLLVYLGEHGMAYAEVPDLSGVTDRISTIENGGSADFGTNAPEAADQDSFEDYVLPEASSKYYSYEELNQLSTEELRIGRNEIMARHGRTFRDQVLQDYFNSKPWYEGNFSPDEFDELAESLLNEVEKENIKIIKKVEAER